jgi:hypothetical protein
LLRPYWHTVSYAVVTCSLPSCVVCIPVLTA